MESSSVIARGTCWNTKSGPTLSDKHTQDGNGIGEYSSELSGLTPGTTYYVRAYTTNDAGTTSATLAANTPIEGSGQWTIISREGGSFDDDTKPDAVFAGQINTTYTLQWKISTQCNASEDLVKICFFVPNYGSLKNLCRQRDIHLLHHWG